jgi:hypothetical protein
MNANRLRTRPARGRAKFYRFLPFFTELDRVWNFGKSDYAGLVVVSDVMAIWHVGGFAMGAGLMGIAKLVTASSKPKTKRAAIRVPVPAPKAAVAPLDAPTAEPTIYVYQNETQYGPYNRFQIREMLADRSIISDAQYWSEGMPEWRSVSELAEGAGLAR